MEIQTLPRIEFTSQEATGLGGALLMPPIRKSVFNFLRKRVNVQKFDMGGAGQTHPNDPRNDPDVIDGEFQEIDPDKPEKSTQNKPSGWTKH